ncbi:MAG: hypothetical protein JNK26_02155 [Candidatus Doudnabacteria bacterium]|nr:hypothetical protein [Candidatus Doudnabacteria bacterium]
MTNIKQLLQKTNNLSRPMVVLITVLLVFVAVQFMILATLGTKGGEIGLIRAQMESLRVENDNLRAAIDRTKTVANIEEDMTNVFALQTTYVEKIVTAPSDQFVSLDN